LADELAEERLLLITGDDGPWPAIREEIPHLLACEPRIQR
jgi:hypothetical protein